MSSLTEALTQQTGTAARRAGNKAFRGFQEATRVMKGRVPAGSVETILMWPPVTSGEELADLSARLRWYLPAARTIQIPVADATLEPRPVDWFEVVDQQPPPNVELVAADAVQSDPDLVLVWKDGRRSYVNRTVLRHLDRVTIVDPDYLAVNEPMGYARLAGAGIPEAETVRLRESSKAVFEQLLDDSQDASKILLYGTGPSMKDITASEAGANIVIACNSSVRDREWIAANRPKLIAFADPIFHFSPNRYAKQFWQDLDVAIEIADSLIVTLDIYVPLIARHMPHLIDRTIGLSATAEGDIAVPSPEDPRVVRTANILTLVMLPMAAALGDDVAIAGCDGRAKSETYFWKHNSEGQYSDELMTAVQHAHPAFFRDRSYGGYYKQHCDILDAQIRSLEAQGIRVSCATPSLIPALANRM